jgi:hypothetical protein
MENVEGLTYVVVYVEVTCAMLDLYIMDFEVKKPKGIGRF